MPAEFGGNFLQEIRAEIEESSYRRVLWVGFELFVVVRGVPRVPRCLDT